METRTMGTDREPLALREFRDRSLNLRGRRRTNGRRTTGISPGRSRNLRGHHNSRDRLKSSGRLSSKDHRSSRDRRKTVDNNGHLISSGHRNRRGLPLQAEALNRNRGRSGFWVRSN